jgi:hypothetical protein
MGQRRGRAMRRAVSCVRLARAELSNSLKIFLPKMALFVYFVGIPPRKKSQPDS